MEKEQWEIERDKIKEAFIKFPKNQGKRNLPYVYNRRFLLCNAANNKWKGDVIFSKIEHIINNDTPDSFYTKGILKYNWPIDKAHRIMKLDYYNYDVSHDNAVVSQVINETITHINDIITVFKTHYNDYSDSLLYVMTFSDDGVLRPYKKVGKTSNTDERKREIKLVLPYDICKIKTWEIQYNKLRFVEKYIHKKIQKYNKRGEFFNDPNGDLITIISQELKHLSKEHNIYIKEIL